MTSNSLASWSVLNGQEIVNELNSGNEKKCRLFPLLRPLLSKKMGIRVHKKKAFVVNLALTLSSRSACCGPGVQIRRGVFWELNWIEFGF